MPLDAPRDEDFDDSLPEVPGLNQLMNITNEDDFDFTSDEDDDDNNAPNEGRYSNYQLINGDINQRFPISSDSENEDVTEDNNNRFYTHNVVVQWIETNEPLFDRAAFENSQRREQSVETVEQVDNSNSINASQINEPSTSSPVQYNTVPMDNEKIDVIKGLMSNFKLPEESVPSWAKEISEDQWKTFLNNKVKDK